MRHASTEPVDFVDFVDIGDISRKPLKLLDFLNVHGGDISGDIFGDGDFRTQDTLRVLCTGRFDGIGEPLSPKVRTQPEFGLVGSPSGST